MGRLGCRRSRSNWLLRHRLLRQISRASRMRMLHMPNKSQERGRVMRSCFSKNTEPLGVSVAAAQLKGVRAQEINMRIYFSPGSDPMITGTVDELNTLASKFSDFLSSSTDEIIIPAQTDVSPAPHDHLLPALRLYKRPGPIMVEIVSQVGLSVAGSPENLNIWCSEFRFPPSAEDGDHHHPESMGIPGYIQRGTLSTIIEVYEPDED